MSESKEQTPISNYARLAAINVNEHVEKKGKLSYLSWVWAVDQLFRQDPNAQWNYEAPLKMEDGTLMVFCTVTAFGVARRMQLPVMNHLNKAIANPNAFDLNTAMQRCLVKAIALHGLGLYIYAGEDLPPAGDAPPQDEEQGAQDQILLQNLRDAAINGTAALKTAWGGLTEEQRDRLRSELASLKEAAAKADPVAKAKAALKTGGPTPPDDQGSREPGSEG